MKLRLHLLKLSLLVLSVLPATAFAQFSYSTTFLPPQATFYGVNNAGQWVGDSIATEDGPRNAYLWTNGVARDLGSLGVFSTGQAISSNGLVTGYSTLETGETHAFLHSGGVMRDLGAFASGNSFGRGVNAAGQVVGESANAEGTDRAFLYSGGTMNDIGTLGGLYAQAWGINDAGAVVGLAAVGPELPDDGAHAFIYQRGAMTDLGTLGGGASWATAINNAGQVTGNSLTDTLQERAFLYSDGTMQDIGTLGGPLTLGRALNSAGMVVGYSTGPDHMPGEDFSHAFLYKDGAMLDLNGMIERRGVWTLVDAVGINDAQEILGLACDEFTGCQYVLLSPIPEPATYAMLLAGLVLVGLGGSRRSSAACRRA